MTSEVRDGAYVPFPSFAAWGVDFDSSVIDLYTRRLAEAKAGASDDDLARAVQVATRYAAVDTGAIEGLYSTNRGFTRTIAEQTANWEAALAQHGDHVKHSIEDALRGYEMVLDAATRRAPVTETWIRQLHEVLCASQDTYDVYTAAGAQRQPLPKGAYKTMPSNPTNADTGRLHHYASPTDTPIEMQRLVDQLRTPEFEAAHPVVQAAYAHYAFVCVHPFADGNGRVSRTLASVYLYRSPGVPLVVFADQKDQHLDALEAADDGRPTDFVSFVNERAIDTTELVRSSLSGATKHETEDALHQRLAQLVTTKLTQVTGSLALPATVSLSATTSELSSSGPVPDGYRHPHSVIRFGFRAGAPAGVTQNAHVMVWSARIDHTGPDFLIRGRGGREVGVFLRDVHPAATHLLDLKLEHFVDAEVTDCLDALAGRVHNTLVDKGYRTDT